MPAGRCHWVLPRNFLKQSSRLLSLGYAFLEQGSAIHWVLNCRSLYFAINPSTPICVRITRSDPSKGQAEREMAVVAAMMLLILSFAAVPLADDTSAASVSSIDQGEEVPMVNHDPMSSPPTVAMMNAPTSPGQPHASVNGAGKHVLMGAVDGRHDRGDNDGGEGQVAPLPPPSPTDNNTQAETPAPPTPTMKLVATAIVVTVMVLLLIYLCGYWNQFIGFLRRLMRWLLQYCRFIINEFGRGELRSVCLNSEVI